MNRDEVNAAGSDVFLQAREGFAVPVDPELADAMGAFEEKALTSRDVDEDRAHEAEEAYDGE